MSSDRIFGLALSVAGLALLSALLGIAELAIRQEMLAPWETWGGYISIFIVCSASFVAACMAVLCGFAKLFGGLSDDR